MQAHILIGTTNRTQVSMINSRYIIVVYLSQVGDILSLFGVNVGGVLRLTSDAFTLLLNLSRV